MKVPHGTLATVALALICSTYTLAESGADLYKSKGCSACHGSDGAGQTTMGKNLRVRDLGSADVQNQSDEELTAIIAKGKGRMPAQESKLSKEQINDLVKWIRKLKK